MNLAYCRLPIGERESMFFTTIISDLSIPSNNESVKPVLPSPAPSQQASPKNNHTRTSYEIDVDSVIQDGRTTCMIRNIPNKYTQQMLIDLINETHADTYDFVYLRMDFKNKCNVGYAFINFVHPRHIGTFHRRLVGKRWPRFNSDKICGLSYARIQGQKALVEKFRHSRYMA